MISNFKTFLIDKMGVTPKELQEIEPFIVLKRFEKGEVLLAGGQVCNSSFFVEKGLLRFYSVTEKGKEHILQFASENWLVSDRGSVYFQEPSKYYIDAIEPSEVVIIDDSFITALNANSVHYQGKNEILLHNHIRQLNKRINMLLGATAEVRYLDFIQSYPDVTLRVPKWMIASYLGVTPESLSRVRKEVAVKNSALKH